MPTCPHHPDEELIDVVRGWYCGKCDRSVLSPDGVPIGAPPPPASSSIAGQVPAPFDRAPPGLDLSRYPFPVAHPLDHVATPGLSPGEALDNVLFAAGQAVRLTALVLLADYLAQSRRCADLVRPIRGLQMPHWQEWSLLCDRLCAFWQDRIPQAHPERPTAFPSLVEGWCEVNRRRAPTRGPWVSLLDGLPGRNPVAYSANDALWRARNDRAHRKGTRTPDRARDAAKLERLLDVVSRQVETLFPAGELTLLLGASGGGSNARSLTGPRLDAMEVVDAAAWAPVLERSRLIAVGRGVAVGLFPLAVPSMDGDDEPFCMIDKASRRQVTVLGVQRAQERPDLAAAFAALAEGAAVELGGGWAQARREGLATYTALTASERIEDIRGRSYLPESYLPRPQEEEVLAELAGRSGRALLVVGGAGSGKSSLLATLVERCLSGRPAAGRGGGRGAAGRLSRYLGAHGDGDAVLYVTGRQLTGDASRSARALLCEALMGRAGVRSDVFDDLAHFTDRLAQTAGQDPRVDRLVWIVIDGLDEAPRFADLVGAIDAFLPALGRHPWLRLVVSMRTGAYAALERRRIELGERGRGVFANRRFWHPFAHPQTGEEVPYLALQPFDGDEQARAAYALRQRALPARSSPLEYDGLSPTLQRLLRSPLHLHLFHETFREKDDTPRDLDEARLFDAYLDRLRDELPNARKTLAWAGERMYEDRRPTIPLGAAHRRIADWRREHGFGSTAQVVKLDPIEELVAANALVRREGSGEGGEGEVYSFAHPCLGERILHEELDRRTDGRDPDPGRLARWVAYASGGPSGEPFQALESALEDLVGDRVRGGDGPLIASLLSLDDARIRDQLLAAAVQRLGSAWGGEDGGAGAGVLTHLAEAIAADPSTGARFEVPARRGRDRLVAAGHGAVARRVDRVRLDILRRAVERSPADRDVRLALARVLVDLGQLDQLDRDLTGARRRFEESLDQLRRLARDRPDEVELRRDVSVALNLLAGLARSAGRRGRAREWLAESTAVMRDVCASPDGRTHRSDLAIALSARADLAAEAGDAEGAGRWSVECLEVMDAACAAEPDRADLRRDRAVAMNNAARIAQLRGDAAGARDLAEAALEALRSLVADEPHRGDLQRDLALVLNRAAARDVEHGLRADAATRFAEAARLMERRCAAEPWRRDLLLDLAITRWNEAEMLDDPEREALLPRVVAALETLRSRGALSPAAAELWTLVCDDPPDSPPPSGPSDDPAAV